MSDKENFESLHSTLLLIEDEELKAPNLPIDVANNETLYLYQIATREKDILSPSGLDLNLISDLPTRVGALRYAQALWNKVFKDRSAAEEQWNVLSKEAFDLRDELLHYCKYAYKNNKSLLETVYRINEGASSADMVQDLIELAVLGKENTSKLEVVGCDITKLDRAEQLAEEVGILLSKVNDDRSNGDKPAKEMRDRAYSYLKQAVDTIREAGRFVHWKDEEKAKQYASAYFREIRENNKNTEV